MVKEIHYTNIKRVLDDLIDDAHMENLTLEQVVRHTVRFINKHGYPKMYQDHIADVEIHEYKGLLPCDLISIMQVKDCKTGTYMRSMTDYFPEGMKPAPHPHKSFRGVDRYGYYPELTFKTQGRIIYTSFDEGLVQISYRAIPVDEDNFPLLIDNDSYLDALEAYITMKVLRNKFRQGKVSAAVYQDAQQEYAVAARELMTEMTTPSVSEMESYTRYFNSLIPRVREFDKGFRNLGDREYLRIH